MPYLSGPLAQDNGSRTEETWAVTDNSVRPGSEAMRNRRERGRRRRVGALLWIVALAVMLAAATYQRRTGPTYPLRGEIVLAGDTAEFALIRSEETTREARVEMPIPGTADARGTLLFRRFPTDEPFTAVPMTRQGDTLAASLPVQPPAGKVEYRVEVQAGDDVMAIPEGGQGTVILRYKDPVPTGLLLPHVLLMFFAMLAGVRTGLGALVGTDDVRRYAWITLGLMTIGGLILGPLAQEAAFGELWTGWPNGYDLTDNKTLIMWLVWVGACGVLGLRHHGGRRRRAGRIAVGVATLIMLGVYMVPHSFRGSQLDYTQLEEGVDPADAIETGG